MPKLYVAIFTPVEGNYDHWALYIEDMFEGQIFQVLGEHPTFVYDEQDADPSDDASHKDNILVADVNEQDIELLQETIRNTSVDNSTVHWNCQDFVLEALERLEEECVIDEDDEHYPKGKRRLHKLYGAKI